jgi:hypothetical protein
VEGESLQELVKKQAMLIEQQAEIIKRQEAEIAGLRAQIVELQTTIAHLHKDSWNSSKPPSSDLVNLKRKKQKKPAVKTGKLADRRAIRSMSAHPFPPNRLIQQLK